MHTVLTPLASEAGGRIAVSVDGSAGSGTAVQRAAAIARQRHGRLTIIAIAPKPWITVALAGISPRQLEREMLESTQRAAQRLAAEVPADVPCTTVVRCGNRARETDRYLHAHAHDMLITVPPAARRAFWTDASPSSIRPVPQGS